MNPEAAKFDPADRTYEVSDERLKAYLALSPEQRLRWVEELAAFMRMARIMRNQVEVSNESN